MISKSLIRFEVRVRKHVRFQDLGANGKTSVRVIEGEEYVRTTGSSLFLKKELDYEVVKLLKVVLEAVDYGKPSLSKRKSLTIFVTVTYKSMKLKKKTILGCQ